jgi:hypothetical protein
MDRNFYFKTNMGRDAYGIKPVDLYFRKESVGLSSVAALFYL